MKHLRIILLTVVLTVMLVAPAEAKRPGPKFRVQSTSWSIPASLGAWTPAAYGVTWAGQQPETVELRLLVYQQQTHVLTQTVEVAQTAPLPTELPFDMVGTSVYTVVADPFCVFWLEVQLFDAAGYRFDWLTSDPQYGSCPE